jgi:hypothetical protein
VPRELWMIVGVAALATTGCQNPDTSSMLSITFGPGEFAPPVEVDSNCSNGGCDGLEELEARLTFDQQGFVSGTAQVEILEYRVDYSLYGLDTDKQPPYYAGLTDVLVDVGSTADFNVRAAGTRQRDWVALRYGTEQLDGTGTLTLAGYDQLNNLVHVEADFDISFGDFVTSGATQ